MPVTATSLAFGARRRNVTRRSAETSGDFTGAADGPPRPGAFCAQTPAAATKNRVAVVILTGPPENQQYLRPRSRTSRTRASETYPELIRISLSACFNAS